MASLLTCCDGSCLHVTDQFPQRETGSTGVLHGTDVPLLKRVHEQPTASNTICIRNAS